MKVIVIGSSGFIGNHLVEMLNSSAVDLVLLTRPGGSELTMENPPNCRSVVCDIRNIRQTRDLLLRMKPDVLVHAASGLLPLSDRNAFEKEQLFLLHPSMQLFETCADVGARLVFLSSAGAVYGDHAGSISELSMRRPVNYYGYSKLLLEEKILFLSRVAGLSYLILRPTNVYGRAFQHRRQQGLIEIVSAKMERGDEITIWGSGEQTRDYMHVSDFVEITSRLIFQGVQKQILNIGSGREYSVLEAVHIVASQLGRVPRLNFREEPPNSIADLKINIDLLRTFCDWNCLTLEKGVELYLKSGLSND